jgi:hypothetical protein
LASPWKKERHQREGALFSLDSRRANFADSTAFNAETRLADSTTAVNVETQPR